MVKMKDKEREVKYGHIWFLRSTQANRSDIKAIFKETYQNIFNELADKK